MKLLIDMNQVPKGAILRIKGYPGYYKVFRRDFKRNKVHVRKIIIQRDGCYV